MKIKLFTHVDLDGIGCALLGKLAFENIDIEYVNYDDVNEKIKNFINDTEYAKYDKTYITDMSVNEEVAKEIDHVNYNYNFSCLPDLFILLDHHKTAEWLNYFDWATVIDVNQSTSMEGYKESGTSLLYEHLINSELLDSNHYLSTLVNLIRIYDTWEWKRVENEKVGEVAKDLNDIFFIIGRDDFIAHYIKHMKYCEEFAIKDLHKELLRYKRQENNLYLEKKLKQVELTKDKNGHNLALVTADSIISELGEKILESFAVEYCAIFTGIGYSLRSRGNFDVSKIAKEYGGGGHKNAAAFRVNLGNFYIGAFER